MEIVTDLNRRAIDWQQLCELLEAAGLGKRDPHTLRRVYQHSQFCYWGFIGDELIATAHAISDLTSVAYLADVAIDPRFQGQGLGRRLMDRVMQDLAPLGKIFIYSVPEKLAFYKKYGFHDLTTGMVYADGAPCSACNREATCVKRASQGFAHKDAAGSRRQARHFAHALPAMPLIKVRRLKADGVQHGGKATASAPLLLKAAQQLAAQPCAAQRFRQIKKIEKQQP